MNGEKNEEDGISPEELKPLLEKGKVKLIDIREQWEYEICSIRNAPLIPMGELLSRMNEFGKSEHIVLYCHTDNRSSLAAQIFKQASFKSVKYLKGGVVAWAQKIEPGMPTY